MAILLSLFCILLARLFVVLDAAPTALVAPIQLDMVTSIYTMKLLPPSPSGNSPLLIDLDGGNLWRDCVDPHIYSSPSFKPLLCNDTSACALAQSSCTSIICGSAGCLDTCSPDGFAFPACNNNSCSAWASISTTKWVMNAAVWWDSIALLSTDGRRAVNKVTIPHFAFVCTDNTLLKGGEGKIPSGAVGGAGLSKSPIALPEQISSKVPSIARKFAYCLPSSPSNSGVIFFGNGPYVFQPGIELSTFLRYTPLVSFSKEADSYLINVISISVGGVILPINGSMLKIHRDKASRSYVGGTRFSSSVPYTLLAPSIYGALISEFRKAAIAQGMKLVGPVSPFGLCFDASTMKSTRLGYNVPLIEIALKGEGKSKKETWQIYGANSVVRLSDQVYCLAFQTTDQYESRSIVIGTYQQKDAFFEFDLQVDRLGFISSLLGLRTTCSNFKFV